MLQVVREVIKLCMFVVLWVIPANLANTFHNGGYLWGYIVSFIVTVGVFSHYEDLERTDRIPKCDDEEDKEDGE